MVGDRDTKIRHIIKMYKEGKRIKRRHTYSIDSWNGP